MALGYRYVFFFFFFFLNNQNLFFSRYFSGSGVAASCEKALDYYRRVAASVAAEVSFSGGATVQRIRLQVSQALTIIVGFKNVIKICGG